MVDCYCLTNMYNLQNGCITPIYGLIANSVTNMVYDKKNQLLANIKYYNEYEEKKYQLYK
ncbi:hypothetical protein AB837_00483 [bacterium AB1]|nr:hypothetical protein AB837_00483 [bacterium AB1]